MADFVIQLFYNFRKKRNSTKRPSEDDGPNRELGCNIRSRSSVFHPVAEIPCVRTFQGEVIQWADAASEGWNYAYIPELDRYYFIDDIIYDEGMWILNLECDVLATYKETIAYADLYILRGANLIDGNIPDQMWPIKGNSTKQRFTCWDNYPTGFESGYFVLTVMGRTNAPGVTTYQMNRTQFTSFVNALYSTADGYQWGDFTQGAINSLFNPEEKIVSCYWFPDSFPTSGTGTICLGLWNSGVTANIVDANYSFSGATITIPKHPKASTYGNYLNLAPYTEHSVELNTGEIIKIDSSKLLGITTATVTKCVDPLTGLAVIQGLAIGSSSVPNQTLFKCTVPWGVPINLAVGKNNLAGVIGGLVTSAMSVASGSVGAVVGSALGLSNEFINGITGSVSNSTSVASIVHHVGGTYWHSRFFDVADRDTDNLGGPICKKYWPITVQGYMVAASGDIECHGTQAERNAIAGYLTTGFYYE